MLEFGLQYSVEDPVAYDIVQCNLNGRYVLPLLWQKDTVLLPNKYAITMLCIKGLIKHLKRE